MRPGARTPEELETLLEDAFVTRSSEALSELFEDGAVLVQDESREARGRGQITRLARQMWQRNRTYLADSRRILQARGTGLIVAERGVNVVRRGSDGAWRYAIALLSRDGTTRGGPMKQDTDQMSALHPLAVSSDEGEARWWFGALAVIKTTAAETGGQLTIVDVTNPPGMEAPLHVHYRDDEGFWILEGSATIEVGDDTIEARVGDYVFGPRGVPHRYTVGDAGCRMLFIMVPGGLEDVIRATSEPASSRTLPPPPEEEPDMEAIKAIVKEHGYELLV